MSDKIEKLAKGEIRKKQDSALDKQRIELPEFNIQSRIVGINKNLVFSIALAGSLFMNWKLLKRVDGLGAEVERIGRGQVSVEVNNHSLSAQEQQRYLDRKLGQMKSEIINSIQNKTNSDFQTRPIGRTIASRSIMPSAVELIEQIDIQQYSVADSQQYRSFRSLLKGLSRMRQKYRKEVQNIVKAYSNTHHISGVDRSEYELVLDKRREAFDMINDLHEQVKEDWKLKNKVSARF